VEEEEEEEKKKEADLHRWGERVASSRCLGLHEAPAPATTTANIVSSRLWPIRVYSASDPEPHPRERTIVDYSTAATCTM
jgi:hypothetical protein